MAKTTSKQLADYRQKRQAGATPEPFGRATAEKTNPVYQPMFVVQQHRARALHFDLRLEIDGVLKSWAVPKGPSANPADKRFARRVEDHPLDYADFEGRIPAGNYGAGWVIVWDRGTYVPQNDFRAGLESGKLLFELVGHKLHGRWTLVRMKSADDWLFIKERDDQVRDNGETYPADSVLSGLTLEALPKAGQYAGRLARRVNKLGDAKPINRALNAAPMLAVAGEAFNSKDWLFEFKYDGYRLVATKQDDNVALRSRNGRPLNQSFPDIVNALAKLPFPHLVLDGELVVHNDSGLPDFGRLQLRAALSGDVQTLEAARHLPASYYVFDLLAAADRDLRPVPLSMRKQLLEFVLPSTGPLRYSAHVKTYGQKTYATAKQLGLEGIVAKRADSPYRAGRSRDWVKVRARKSDDFVIAGYAPNRSNPKDIGALALAEFRGETLTYVGKVGSGLRGNERGALQKQLDALPPGTALNDNDEIVWVQPKFVCEVLYREYTSQGQLRQPVFARLRDDKSLEDCKSRFDDPQPPRPIAEPRDVPVTNREKIFFPEESLTKGDLVDYYEAIAPWMLPYLEDRPLVLTRFPDGIHGKSFYQRDAPDFVPDWITRQVLWSEGAEREVSYFLVQEAASLVYLANMGTIPIHTWHSRVTDLEHPDWCILDLDPKGAPFLHVVEIARVIRDLTEELELPAFPKTSGASGLHVLIPLGRQLTHDQSKTLGELLARVVVERAPDIATIARSVRRREGKVYVDFLQNGHGKLLVAPFSVRAEPAASVSMPIGWHEVNRGLSNTRFTIINAVKRMKRMDKDPLRDVLTVHADLAKVLERLLKIVG